jgi:hypothetical protein
MEEGKITPEKMVVPQMKAISAFTWMTIIRRIFKFTQTPNYGIST